MTTQQRIERKGYTVTYCLSGWITATKNGRTYKADTITGILKLITAKL